MFLVCPHCPMRGTFRNLLKRLFFLLVLTSILSFTSMPFSAQTQSARSATTAPVSECLYQQTSREGGVKNARHINHISWASLQYSKESNVKILKHPYILCISMEIKGKLGYKRLFLSLSYSCTLVQANQIL